MLDTILRVFDASGPELAVNDDAGGLDSRIAFIAPATGTYAVGISGFANFGYDPNATGTGANGSGTGAYLLNAELAEDGTGPGTIFGTTGDDAIDVSDRGVLVFAGDGDDFVDGSRVPDGGVLSSNIVIGGRGNDLVLAGRGDQIFGDGGDDRLLSPSGSGGNRLFGGEGGDILIAGDADILAGGDGDDTLFAGPGRSTLAGDAGADLFWAAAASLSTFPNTITDFTRGEDLTGLGGLGFAFRDLLLLTVEGSGSLVAVPFGGGDVRVVRLVGVRPQDLGPTDFVFA